MIDCNFKFSRLVIKYSSLLSSFKVRTACPTAKNEVRSLNPNCVSTLGSCSYKQATVVPTRIHYPAAWEQWRNARHIATEDKRRMMGLICLNNGRGRSKAERRGILRCKPTHIVIPSERIRPYTVVFDQVVKSTYLSVDITYPTPPWGPRHFHSTTMAYSRTSLPSHPKFKASQP